MYRNTVRSGWRIFWLAALSIVLITATILVLVFATGWGKRLTAGFRGETAEREMTEASGRFRLATYEDFFDLCTSVQNAEARAANLEAELESGPTAARESQINSSLTAVRNQRASSANEYNSKAAQEHRTAFLSNNLPEKIDLNEENTECAA